MGVGACGEWIDNFELSFQIRIGFLITGQTWKALDTHSNIYVAIKLEDILSRPSLPDELRFYLRFSNHPHIPGIPKVMPWLFYSHCFTGMVMELLGPSLEDKKDARLKEANRHQLSIQEVLELAGHMVCILTT
jgi:hypothetical protein